MAKKKDKEQLADEIESVIESGRKGEESVEFISTGCIPLNLAISQKGRLGGIPRARITNFVGDGGSGKTILALEIAANWFYNHKNVKSKLFPEIKKLSIVYNNSEGVMDFPLVKMYGQEFFDFVNWTYIDTCQGFGRDIQKRITALKSGESLLYIQDSLDSTISEEAKARIEKSIKSDKPEDSSFGTEKPKYFSQSFFNDVCERQRGKDATIILISQVRENLNAGMFGKKLYRTGGKALDFYTHCVPWLYNIEKLKKTFRTQDRIYGVKTKAKIERNKVAVPFREADFPIIFDYGIDNIQSCADFLFGPKDKEIEWNDESMKKSELINLAYEDNEVLEALIDEVEKEWESIESNIRTKRPPRYSNG